MNQWHVYILRCADESLYTGLSNDVARRLDEHNNNDRLAAKYTRVRRPVQLVYQETYDSRSDAAVREAEIKKLNRQSKEKLVLGKI
ncbi:MAG: GIY-YIG nuclease family protein [Gammaproteobacteria bacterium]|nr:GIY-YIG nuclease family protein [Gammaproteobacteria bacterium]MDH5594745.1 GIY-YIG nuclease family protein [Gammaproteobacteria bacterium]